VHVPPLFHAVDLQIQVYAGSLYAASEPMHPIQTVALVHPVQLLLQAKLLNHIFLILSIFYIH
jgi:hypothetical protein